ncbi:MAG: GNAT family N-acetyltransferase [Alphaproteobacteria bacterium]
MLYTRTLVAEDFAVPETVETPCYRLRKLTIADLDADFEAVTSSEDHLRGVFGAGNTWPAGLTRERDLADLGWHETEFNLRTSFAYTVISLDESLCLGCVYIYPSRATAYDAFCTMWVRASVVTEGLDEDLFGTVKNWLAEVWPFDAVAFPGRELRWDAFEAQF